MRHERLRLLAEMLAEVIDGTWRPTALPPWAKQVTRVDWNMSDWGHMDDCGLAACAVGHAAVDERFPGLDDLAIYSPRKNHKRFDTEEVAKYFGISARDAKELFLPDAYDVDDWDHDIRPEDVLARVNDIIGVDDDA